MVSALVSLLVATVSAAPGAPSPKPAAVSGLIGSGQLNVRVVVVDRCTVGPSGAVCQGVAPIKPLAVAPPSASRIDIVF